MGYLVLLAVVVVIIVVAAAWSGAGRGARGGDLTGYGPGGADEGHDLHHDASGTPYGAMDAEFEDWG
jgi:hypothetical protein